jgi:MFS family permease
MNVLATLAESFSPLKNRNFRIYIGGQAISLIGTWLQATAQGWVVWELSRSPGTLGLVTMLGFLPQLILGPFAGVWADRLDRRKILITTQAIQMILAFVLAILVGTGVVQIWHIAVLAILLGASAAMDFPAQQAFLGDLSGMGEIRKAVVVNASIFQTSRIVGPALAGFVIGVFGAATAFWLNGLSFIAVIVSLIVVRAQQVRRASGGNPLSEIVEGLRFIKGQPRLIDLILSTVFITFFGLSVVITLFPAFAGDVLKGDATTLGLITAASGAGALISALILTPIAQSFKRTGAMIALCCAWAGIWMMVASRTTWLPAAMLCIFLVGLTVPVVVTTANGMLQFLAPNDMRARLLAVFITISFGIQPIAAGFVGFIAEHVGVPNAMLLNGALLIVCTLLLFVARPAWRNWQVGRPTAPQPVAQQATQQPAR